MAGILEMMGHIQSEGERGKQAGLSRLIGKAYNDPSQRQAALGRVAQLDGPAAFNAQAMFEKMDDRGRQRLGQRMAVFSALPDDIKAQAYPDIAREAQALGIPAPGEWNPEFAPHMQKIAQALGAGSAEAEQFTLGPGSKRFDPSGKVIAEVPFAPANANLVTVPDGQGGAVQMIYDPRTRQLSEPQYPGQGQPAAAAPAGAAPQIMGDALSSSIDPQAIQNEFKTLAPQFGAQISSLTRTPERNAAVGGVPNSQHLAGTAGDFVVPEANKGAFRQAMQQRGFEVIDEGDHMHVELPTGRQVAQGGARLGYTPPKAQTKAPSDVERRIELARGMGASEDEIKRLVLGGSAPGASNKPLPVQAVKADLEIEDALGAAEGVFAMSAKHLDRMARGELVVGTPEAAASKVRTFLNMPTDNDVALNELKADRTSIVNASLRLNKGVQTEGDAQRAVNELMSADDHKTTLAAFKRLVEINKRAAELQQRKRALLYQNYGKGQQQSAPATGGVLKWNPATGDFE